MSRTSSIDRPRVRFSLRWKITLPFMFLALALGLAATVIVNRVLGEAEEVRFLRQLADSGQQAADEGGHQMGDGFEVAAADSGKPS